MQDAAGVTVRRTLILSAVMLCSAVWAESLGAESGNDLLARSIALYPTLASYADTATVVREAPGIVDRWKFRTYFRQPLDFYFDFQGVTSTSAGVPIDMSGQRIVLWMRNGELESFNQQMRTHETIPRATGNQPAVLQSASAGTAGTSILIPALIFVKANLAGTLNQIRQATDAGFETVGGRRCHKIIGMAAQYYPSGQMTNARQVTVWLDAGTLLVRKVFEDTPKGYPAGGYARLTVTIEPQMNPDLDDSKFRFTVPTFQQ